MSGHIPSEKQVMLKSDLRENDQFDVGLAMSGLYGVLVNYDDLYDATSDQSILINHFNMKDPEDEKRLNAMLFTEYDGDILESKPHCECKRESGEPSLGKICQECGTPVISSNEKPMESILWAEVPDGVIGFIHPQAWTVLNDAFRHRRVDMIRYMVDPNYRVSKQLEERDSVFLKLKGMKWKRSINHFITNFDEAMDFLLGAKIVTPVSQRVMVEAFIEENRALFFPRYLPVPNKALFITESTAVGTYVDDVICSAVDMVRNAASDGHRLVPVSQQVKENRVAKSVHLLATFYSNYTNENLAGKPGIYRRQIYGGRLDFTGRAVISSITKPHVYDELHLPWAMGLTILKPHISSKLRRRGFTPNEANRLIVRSLKSYSPILDEVLQELLNEAPGGAIPFVFQRNPTLLIGSAQQLRVTLVKGMYGRSDLVRGDTTISLSALILKSFN